MGFAIGFVAFLALYAAFVYWKHQVVKPVALTSTSPPEVIRDVFARKVATTGWKIVDDGNPMIAQSPLLGGIRQQVALTLLPADGGVKVEYETIRYVRKALSRTPTKAITLASRKGAFLKELKKVDAQNDGPSQQLPTFPPTSSLSPVTTPPVMPPPVMPQEMVAPAMTLAPGLPLSDVADGAPLISMTPHQPVDGSSFGKRLEASNVEQSLETDDCDDDLTVKRSSLIGDAPLFGRAEAVPPAPPSPHHMTSMNDPVADQSNSDAPWYTGQSAPPVGQFDPAGNGDPLSSIEPRNHDSKVWWEQ